jgi:quinol monooxygenase YgiN
VPVLVVIASIPGKADKREEITAALTKTAKASREDPGCVSYAFHVDIENVDRYVSVEVWQDQESLDAHFQTEHIAELFAVAGDLLDGEVEIQTYETEGPKG